MNTAEDNYEDQPDEYQEDWLSAYLDDELSEGQRQIVEERLRYDSAAQQLLADLSRVRKLVGSLPAWPSSSTTISLPGRVRNPVDADNVNLDEAGWQASNARKTRQQTGVDAESDSGETIASFQIIEPECDLDSEPDVFARQLLEDDPLGEVNRAETEPGSVVWNSKHSSQRGLFAWIKPAVLAASLLAAAGIGYLLWKRDAAQLMVATDRNFSPTQTGQAVPAEARVEAFTASDEPPENQPDADDAPFDTMSLPAPLATEEVESSQSAPPPSVAMKSADMASNDAGLQSLPNAIDPSSDPNQPYSPSEATPRMFEMPQQSALPEMSLEIPQTAQRSLPATGAASIELPSDDSTLSATLEAPSDVLVAFSTGWDSQAMQQALTELRAMQMIPTVEGGQSTDGVATAGIRSVGSQVPLVIGNIEPATDLTQTLQELKQVGGIQDAGLAEGTRVDQSEMPDPSNSPRVLILFLLKGQAEETIDRIRAYLAPGSTPVWISGATAANSQADPLRPVVLLLKKPE
jgi:hypothetical protein